MNKALIIVYFGKVGESVLTSLETLLKNEIDVYFFSDNVVDVNSDRLFQFYIDVDDFNDLSFKAIGFNPNLKSAYKLCDFKYFYSIIFKSYFHKDYDYIGFCDVDVLYGRIDNYIHQSMQMGSDVIGSRGHFMLFNNASTRIIDEFFLDRKKVFSLTKTLLESKYHFALDEFNFLHKVLDRLNDKQQLRWDKSFSLNAVDISYFKKPLFCVNRFVLLTKVSYSVNKVCIYHSEKTEEVPYVHYQKRPFPLALDSLSLSMSNSGFSLFSMLLSRVLYKIKVAPFFYVWLRKKQFSYLVDKYL